MRSAGRGRAVARGDGGAARPPRADEAARPWNFREGILNVAHASALSTGAWQQCLELNAEAIASKRDRGAAEHELIRFRFNDTGPLIQLGRLAEAKQLLLECQRLFEEHGDMTRLARVFSTRARWRTASGTSRRPPTWRGLGSGWIRRLEPQGIAIGHHNLANYLRKDGRRPHDDARTG